jgi:protein-tyrosine phosphatase
VPVDSPSYRREVQTIEPMGMERHVRLEGCFNFRDLGGYRARGGAVVRPRRLYRADGPHALTDGDGGALRSLGLVSILDLRTGDEAAERGCFSHSLDPVTVFRLPMTDVLPDVDELATWSDPAVVAQRYREMLDQGSEAVCEALAILTDPRVYPAMMHCSAGKDRTGILSAIVLGAIGVPERTIVADYALSGPAMARFVDFLERTYPHAKDRLAKAAPAMLAADPEAMRGLLAGLQADFGSVEGYLAHLGMAPAVPYLRANLLSL